ncbi:uncharacterized protein [Fopius arisanus]|nr:PREDICTED: uncharacterized protein LOC105273683 isoform X2 [Fopius arisanus]
MEENPFFDPWTVIFDPVGEQVSLKTPIKQDLPPNMMIGIDLILDGIEMMHFESLMCDLFNDPIIGKGIVDHGRPIGVYPTSCPFVANPDLVIENWEFPADKVPPGIPDSSAECTFTVFEKGKPPAVTITGTGKLIHKFPGIGR